MDNSVLISYRRQVSWTTARLVYDSLRRHRYDVFMDVKTLDSVVRNAPRILKVAHAQIAVVC